MGKFSCDKSRKDHKCSGGDHYEICYYKCKKDHKKNCKEDVIETREIIEKIDMKNHDVIDELKAARASVKDIPIEPIREDVEAVNADLESLKNGLANVLADIAILLDLLKDSTIPANEAAIIHVDEAVVEQEVAKDNINKAINKSEKISDLIDELECSYRKTVHCLLEKCESKPMVLVPWEDEDDDCHC